MPRDLELLEIGKEQLLRAVAARGGDGEDLLPQRLEREPGAAGHALGHDAVLVGAGGRFEQDRIGDDAGRQQAASFGLGMTPRSWNMEVTIVQVLPTGSLRM